MPAIASGLIDQSLAPDSEAVNATLNLHITVGIGLLVALGLALYWPLRYRNLWHEPRQRTLYVMLLLLVAVLVLVESWLGGKLVYDLGVGVSAMPGQ
jgi:uncharacterized membrane protein